MTTISLGAMLLAVVPSPVPTTQLATLMQEPSEEQASLPNAAVFFLSESSALSALAMDIVAQAASKAGSGTIVIIRANYDQGGGETVQTARLRAGAVREQLVREGVPTVAIHILISGDATGTGIEARCVVISVIPAKAPASAAAS
jgi:hypothetical protein